MNAGVTAAMERRAAEPARRFSVDELCGPAGLATIANDPPLGQLLRAAPIADAELERLFVARRRA
jgi:hypothetical protein